MSDEGQLSRTNEHDALESDAHAAAARKLALAALELLGRIADHLGLEVDFVAMADAEIDQKAECGSASYRGRMERRASEISANVYRHIAAEREENRLAGHFPGHKPLH